MRKTKKLLSIIMSAAMVATAVPATAFAAGQSGSINGDGEILDTLVYSVVVPTDLAFTVNPLEFDYDLDGTTYNDSIISTGYGFVNKSSVPVQLDVHFQFATPEGITVASQISEIQNTTNEAPTIFMDIEPTDAEPSYVVGPDSKQSVDFTSVNFVSGPAILVSDQAISFKMAKANYELNDEKKAEYKDNNNSGDTIGFRFGGKASMFSDWKNKSLKVNATYGISVIGQADYDDASNTTSGGFNVLDDALVDIDIEADTNAFPMVLTESGEFAISNVPAGWKTKALYYIADTASLSDITTADIQSVVEANIANPVGQTVGTHKIGTIDTSGYTWNETTKKGQFNSKIMTWLSGKNFLWITVMQDGADGEKIVLASKPVSF